MTVVPPEPAPSTRRRGALDAVTGGAAALPLVVMTTLFTFDQFDTAAFGVLAPTIEKAFDLSDQQFGTIVVVNLSLVLLFAIPLGYLGDRLPRTKLVAAGGLVAGAFSLLTGAAGTLALLVLARLGNGVGQLVNEPVHNSLLADYYEPQQRPRVYSWHQNGVYLGAIFGSALAGVMSSLFGWRAAFAVLVVPIALTSLYALRLREPRRGGTDDDSAAAQLEGAPAVSLREGARTLWSVPTLRRQYVAWLFIGAGVLPLAFILPLYLKRTFGVTDGWRGLAAAANAAFQFAGLLTAGRLTQRWLRDGLGEPLRRTGMILMTVGIGLGLIALSPWLVLALVLQFATSFVAGLFYPPFLTTQAMVSPARVRTLSFGFGSLFLVGGVWGLWLLPGVAAVSDNVGIRWGLGALGPYWIVGGAVLMTAARFVADDTAHALRVLSTAAEMRRRALTGDQRILLSCQGVDVRYGQVQVLFGVDFEVEEGEIVALLGTNGAGKSTLLNAISGVVFPSAGAILFDGTDITLTDANTTVAAGVVYVPGGKGVFPTLTVEDNLRLAGWLFKDDPDHVRHATEQVLEYFPVLRDRWHEKAGNLSGGEQQMLTLGQAFIAKPKLLMIDELSLGLAPVVVEQLLDIVRAIHSQGTTIVLVEQSVNVAMTIARRAVFMEKGEVRFNGPTAELLDKPELLRAVFLQGAGPAARGARDGNGAHNRPPRRARPLRAAHRGHGSDRTPILETCALSMAFGGVRAVNGVDLSVHPGEIVGIIGPNGAGKTTLFDLVAGFLTPSSGSIRLLDHDVTRLSPAARASRGLGRSFQDARLFPSMTVRETIAVALERHVRVRDPIAAALLSPAVKVSEQIIAAEVDRLIELMHLSAFADKFVGELSTGSRRVVDLACSVGHDPKVLLLDEPSSGIAQRETEALAPLLLDLRDKTGAALVVIEHDMPLITGISDTMIALELGAVIATGAPREVTTHPRVIESYLGGDVVRTTGSGEIDIDRASNNGAGRPTKVRRR